MDALFALIVWFLGLMNPGTAIVQNEIQGFGPSNDDAHGVHIINVNPRTVVALEDTHFRPNE